MHESRVAGLLRRWARRLRRGFAIGLVATIVASVCVIAESGTAAFADDQPSTSAEPASTPDAPVASLPLALPVTATQGSSGPSGSVSPAIGPALSVTGSSARSDSNHDGRASVGDVVTTTWTVSNSSANPATGVTMAVSRGHATCSASTIAPSGSTTCHSSTTLTQTDLDAAHVSVTGTASGTVLAASSTSNTASASLSLTVHDTLTISQKAQLVSDRDGNGRISEGDSIRFVFTVTNAGTQTVKHVSVLDSRLRGDHVSITCHSTTLAAGQHTTCQSGSYLITSSQARAGGFGNTAQAKATTPKNANVFSAKAEASVGVQRPPAPVHPHLSLRLYVASVANRGGPGRVQTGDTITYGFDITNTGAISVSGLKVTDPKLADLKIAVHCKATSLAPGSSTTCLSDPMTVTNFNITQGQLTNYANVRGTGSNGLSAAAYAKLSLQLSAVTLRSLVGSSSTSSTLPRTGGAPTTPLTIGIWMVLLGFGLVFATRTRRRPVRVSWSSRDYSLR